ncbi:hypothetical protein [Pedobacter psychrodurus]|uniref:hypothetical protein n=1 Tax=Pedobacter psychrodurus TaxID=2530456 RepID=UPI002930E668|nr:hypothetical protein [Pedobacter psychrodurus]
MSLIKHVVMRIAIVGIPLLGWYVYSEIAYQANRMKEHPTDVGLGMAILLTLILFFLFVGFVIDLIVRIRNKQKQIANIDLVFIVLFAVPILYFFSLF